MSGCYFREEPNMGLNMIVSKFRCYTQLHNIQQTFFLDLGLMVNSSVPWLAMTPVTFHFKNVAIMLRIFFSKHSSYHKQTHIYFPAPWKSPSGAFNSRHVGQ